MSTRLRRAIVPLTLGCVASIAVVGLASRAHPGEDARARPANEVEPKRVGTRTARVPVSPPTGPAAPSQRPTRPESATAARPGPPPASAPVVESPALYDDPQLDEILALGGRLRRLLHEGSEERRALEHALTVAATRRGASEPAARVPAEVAALEAARTGDVCAEAQALGRAYPDPGARARLKSLLLDPEARARAEAVRALAAWSDFAGDVLALLEHERDPTVRRVAFSTLAEGAGPDVMTDLTRWLAAGDRREDVDHAVKAIRRIARRAGVEPPVAGLPRTAREERRLALTQAGPAPAPRPTRSRQDRRQPF